jgi:hypothetical protein
MALGGELLIFRLSVRLMQEKTIQARFRSELSAGTYAIAHDEIIQQLDRALVPTVVHSGWILAARPKPEPESPR